MHVHSYKNFLQSRKFTKYGPVIKLVGTTTIILLILAGSYSAFWYNQYNKEAPAQVVKSYLETSTVDFTSTTTAGDELMASFQVAGAKIAYTWQNAEDPDAYFTAVDDLERIIGAINTVRKNVGHAKSVQQNINNPAKFKDLNLSLIAYYENLEDYLLNQASDLRFAKDLTLAVGPDLYLPVLSQKDLWLSDSQSIKSHYEKLQQSAGSSLAKLSRLDVPQKHRFYHQQEIAYISLLVNLATAIINTISVSDDLDAQKATQLEKAYELLVRSERENRQLSDEIFKKRTESFNTKRNLEDFAHIKIQMISLATKLEEAVSALAN